MAELEGRTLDRYELRRLIGKGGMANVYEAYDPSFHRVVAVKVFKREDDEMLRRFIREAQLMAGLHHAHLVQVYDSGECQIDGVPRYYIVMPMMTGGTLRLRIRREPLSLPQVCQCLSDIASALDYIHAAGIIHRDIKSSNVLLNDEGRCYLTDFGIARVVSDMTQLTSTGNVLGTVDYVAPELFEVDHRADERSDLYALGVLLYEMVTGRLPFSADNQLALISMHVNKPVPPPRQYAPQLPPQAERVILKALEKQPERRFASATELAQAFCRAVNVKPSGGDFDLAELQTVVPGKEALAVAPALKPSGARPAPLADGTEGFVLAPQAPVVLPGAAGQTPPSLTPLTPRPRPVSRQRSRRGIFLAIVACAFLLLLAVPVTYVILNYPTSRHTPGSGQNTATTGNQSPISSSATPNLTQTAQGASNATATANAQVTATSIAEVTATANAQASATVGPIETATAGKPAYQDALTNMNNPATQAAGWDQDSQCFFAGDGYHLKQPASPAYFKGCREHNNAYGNLALSVNMVLLNGHSGGIFFRLSTNFIGNYDGYLFEVDSQGNYKISWEQGSTITPLQNWQQTTALHTGYTVKNLLQFVVRGSTFLFYANGHFLTEVQNTYYNQPASIGFLVTSTPGGSDAEVVYSDLKIYSLS